MDLTRTAWIQRGLKSRIPQFSLAGLLLIGFVFAIAAGFVGTPVGSHNFSIVFVWIAWWAFLILLAVPLFGRVWCSVCPIPLAGDWLQRGSLLQPGQKTNGLGRRVPKIFRNIWLQNASFTLVALFSPIILTTPSVTAWVLLGMFGIALGLSLVFERRAFCRYLCPVGGFIGLYSQAAPLELRVKDKKICATCATKACYNGSVNGAGCPWGVFPTGLQRNSYCGLCLECLRTCPSDNLAVNLRPVGADLAQPSGRLDESFKTFIMLGAALIYAAVLLGPWGTLKAAAFHTATFEWLVYTGIFLLFVFALLPGMFWLAARRSFTQMVTSLVPLSLGLWVAFSLSFVLANSTYILNALSDPLGMGWNLFGTAGIAWQPLLSGLVGPLQAFTLAGSLGWSVVLARRIAAKQSLSALPAIVYSLGITLGMAWLLI